jgi:hypothetical protein
VTWKHREPPSPLTTEEHQAFTVPVAERDADAILAIAESRVKYLSESARLDLLADLARFLGATSRVWTTERRRRLEALLVDAGPLAVSPVLRSVITTPREEVIDDAVAVLAGIIEKHEGAAAMFAEALSPPPTGIATAPIVREAMLRAIVRGQCASAAATKLRVAYMLAKVDTSPEVREAAVQALSEIGRCDGAPIVLELLRLLRPGESDPIVVDTIDEAVEAIEGQ